MEVLYSGTALFLLLTLVAGLWRVLRGPMPADRMLAAPRQMMWAWICSRRASVAGGIMGRLLQVRGWQKALDAGEHSLQSWTLAVTLLLLMGIVIALLNT